MHVYHSTEKDKGIVYLNVPISFSFSLLRKEKVNVFLCLLKGLIEKYKLFKIKSLLTFQ
jgi:hypothetical protein